MAKIRWGILSTSRFFIEQIYPAMKKCTSAEMTAIASRSLEKAQSTAQALGIPQAYGAYEELLADPEVDAIYNPMANHLHVPWSIRALEAGKHVLCEKPIGLDTAEARQLLAAASAHPRLKVMEAFMYRHHPQWQAAHRLVREGAIGELRTVHTSFFYNNVDPNDIRNIASVGGGGLLDIGCYAVSVARFIFGRQPERVCGIQENDPRFGTDRLFSAILDFGSGFSSTFTCGTQINPFQRVNIFGTQGRIEIEIPFNPPADQPTRIWLQQSNAIKEIPIQSCNHYTIQADLFSQAILEDRPVFTPLEDAVNNMEVLDRLFESATQGGWIKL